MSATLTTDPLRHERDTRLNHAKAVLARVKASGREFPTSAEHDEMTADLAAAKELDKQIKGRDLVNSVVGLGSVDDDLPEYGTPRHGTGVFSTEASKALVSAVKTRSEQSPMESSGGVPGEENLCAY